MFASRAKFRTIDRTIHRILRPAPLAARSTGLVQSNDNRPSARPVVATRPLRQPVLVARWQRNNDSGRLECRWIIEAVDEEPAEAPCPPHTAHYSARNGRGVMTFFGTPVHVVRIETT
jgi:hypothetical protein